MTTSTSTATRPASAEHREPRSVSVGALLWAALGVLFVLLRFAPIWRMPVGGIELDHLSGAWQAASGIEDPRFVPTFFQALTALLFEWTDSPVPARVLAFLAGATVPVAVYMLRPWLGEAGALVALLVLALNPLGLAVSASASAPALDVPVALWFVVVLLRRDVPTPAWAAVALVIAVGGPLPLTLALAAVLTWALRREPFRPIAALWMAGGAVAGVVAASFGFGHGWQGVTVPPFDIFADGYERAWSSASIARLVVLYGLPALAAGLAGFVFALSRYRANYPMTLLVVWFAVCLAWLAASLRETTPLPVVAMSVSGALIAAPALVAATTAMLRAEWRVPAVLMGAAALVFGIVLYVLGDWSRAGSVGGTTEQILVLGLALIGIAALAACTFRRTTLPTLVAPALLVGIGLALVGTVGVATSARNEPYPSPVVTPQVDQLEHVISEALEEHDGALVIHPELEDGVVWPLREFDSYIVATRVPEDAAVAIWPVDAEPPEGMVPLAGTWAAVRNIQPPDTALRWLRWLNHRNTLQTVAEQVAVYTEQAQ